MKYVKGGAIYSAQSFVYISNTDIINNTAVDRGAAISTVESYFSISNCNFLLNDAHNAAGKILSTITNL